MKKTQNISSHIMNGSPLGVFTICFVGLFNVSCATRLSNESVTRTENQSGAAESLARQKLLSSIQSKINAIADVNGVKANQGDNTCAFKTFAFDLPKEEFEEDAFELRVRFKHPALQEFIKKTATAEQQRVIASDPQSFCTDTRSSRPLVVLSANLGFGNNNNYSLNLDQNELALLGIKDGTAKKGEVIVANLFHLKRFWIARIKTNDVKAAYFQLEHFPIIPIDASDEEKESAKKTIESALNEGKKDTTWWQKLAAIAGTDIKDLGPQLAKLVTGQKADLIEWANNNIAGHTQIRIQFNEPIELVEQVMKNGQLTPQVEKIRDIVLSSEAQGTVVQKGETPLGYDPIKAIQPLFFSVNKLVSLHEKYSDMVVRQRHWIEQFPLLLNLNNTPQSQNPSFEELMAKYIEMSKTNWNSMTQNDPQMIQPALYKTIDFKPPALNQTRNCTTEVITVLEANRPQKWLSFAKARWQDVTFQRAYPMLLGGALADFGLLNEKINFPGMDSDVQVEGEEKLKATDETLVDVRAHFKNLEVCEQYFGPADKAKCITWAQKIL